MIKKITSVASILVLILCTIPIKSYAYVDNYYDDYTINTYRNEIANYHYMSYAEGSYYMNNAVPDFTNTQPTYNVLYGGSTSYYSTGSTSTTTSKQPTETTSKIITPKSSELPKLLLKDRDKTNFQDSTPSQGVTTQGLDREGILTGIISGVFATLFIMGYETWEDDIAERIRNANTENGWVTFTDRWDIQTWGMKRNDEYVRNEWVLSNSKWYYIMPSRVMFEGRYDYDGWSLAPASNGSSYIRWFLFDEKGALIPHEAGWELKNGKWRYWMPNNSGIATNEPVDIQGERFWFDKSGWCSSGRGC